MTSNFVQFLAVAVDKASDIMIYPITVITDPGLLNLARDDKLFKWIQFTTGYVTWTLSLASQN